VFSLEKTARQGRHGVALACVGLAVVGCSGGRGANTPGQDPERQSVAEYDIAQDLWLKRNQPRQALDHALEALELDDENADAAHLIGLIYLDFCRRNVDECRLDRAERYTRRALELREDYREAINTLGVILVHAKRYDEAIATLGPLTEDILYQTPENAWGNLGWAYLEQGDADHAIDALRRSVAAQPAFCVGHYRLGIAYEKKKDAAAAVEAFSHAVEVDDPGCQKLQVAYAARGRALVRLGRTDEARDDLERCVQLDKRTDAGRECGALLAKLE
jgi:type IV pilus assembly protein PilF